MTEPETALRDSDVDFDSAVAYALQPAMRRLIILAIVGTLLVPVGMALFFDTSGELAVAVARRVLGLVVAVVGGAFFFGGAIGAAFKLVYDANMLAFEDAE